MAEQKRRSVILRALVGTFRVLGSMLVTVAKTLGAMGGAQTHGLDQQRKLYEKSKRDDYRP